MKKTNAMRILDNLKIPYEVREYEDNTDHALEKGAANRTAEKLGIPPESVYKTIVMKSDQKEVFVFCQSAEFQINLKKTTPKAEAFGGIWWRQIDFGGRFERWEGICERLERGGCHGNWGYCREISPFWPERGDLYRHF